MTEQEIKDRLAVIDGQLAQLSNNYNVLVGSKQELLYWLDKAQIKPVENTEDQVALPVDETVAHGDAA